MGFFSALAGGGLGTLGGLFGGGNPAYDKLLNASKEARQQAAPFLGQAGASYGAAFPTLAQWARGVTPGFGAQGLGAMLGAGTSAASSAAATREQEAADRALRLGNLGALGATETAAALQGARAGSGAVNDILARNAVLQNQQQMFGLKGLEGLYGAGGRLGEGFTGEEINALSDAGKLGHPLSRFGGALMGGLQGLYGALKG